MDTGDRMHAAEMPHPEDAADHGQPELAAAYRECLMLIERLHRRLLDVIKAELDTTGRAEVNSVQALLLYNIGSAEVTAGELRTRGYYLGSNVSYNLKKLVEMGYLHHQRSEADRRSVRVRLTEKGREIAETVRNLHARHLGDVISHQVFVTEDITRANRVLQNLDQFWARELLYGF